MLDSKTFFSIFSGDSFNYAAQPMFLLLRLQRISLEQCDALIMQLLATPSGGRFPVLLVEATFQAVKERFALDWTIETHGINVADRPSGSGGDITIKKGQDVLLVAEVTERPIDKGRVVATFQTKIGPHGIEDYLFFVTKKVETGAIKQARQYFSQGHEVNFLEIKDWILHVLATLGKKGREAFNRVLVEKFSDSDMPSTLKVAWNNCLEQLTTRWEYQP